MVGRVVGSNNITHHGLSEPGRGKQGFMLKDFLAQHAEA